MERSFVTASLAAALALATLVVGPARGATEAGAIAGVWKNPKNSVHLQIRPCGAGVCGYVVWASAKAQADARKGGTDPLVGAQLLRDFVPKGDGWRGKVFVPDMNATFSGTAELVDRNTLRARGCLLAGLVCKSQIWTRVAS